MENCFKSKLIKDVNNDNLLVFDALVLKINNTTEENKVFVVNGNVGDVINIEASDSKIQFNQQTAPTNKLSFTCTSSNKTVYCFPGEYTVRIKSKYKITLLNMVERVAIDIDTIGMAGLTTISCQYGNSYTGIKTSGDIANLGILTSLASINLVYTDVTGSIENFVKEQVKNGRTSVGTTDKIALGRTTVSIPLGNKNTSYASGSWYLSWESASKMFIFNNATFASATDIYCYGYSDAEITTNTASGGAWEGKTITKCD